MNIKYIMIYPIITTAVIAGSTGVIVVAQNQGTLMISAVMFSENPIANWRRTGYNSYSDRC